MPENGTSGLMSGERKRSVAAWPKLPRLSSTLRAHAGYSTYLAATTVFGASVGRLASSACSVLIVE